MLPERLMRLVSVGLLSSSVPRDVIDEAVSVHGRLAKRSDGSLPPHVMVNFAMAMAVFADDDYEGVLSNLMEPLAIWGGWDDRWEPATSSGIAQARQRLGYEPVKEVFERIAVPVAEELTRGAFCAGRRMVSMDGMVFDVPATKGNDTAFGRPSNGAFPQVRAVSLVECGSHATLGAHLGPVAGKGSGERSAARALFPLLEPEWILLADSGFYSFEGLCQALGTGADVLWRLGDVMDLPVVAHHDDGSYTSIVYAPRTSAKSRAQLLQRGRRGEDLADARERARLIRVVEYRVDIETDDADGTVRELICLITNILDPDDAPAGLLADCYHQRWESESVNDEIKTELRGPGRVLRSKSPDMVRQEIYGYFLAHYALAALICRAATETDTDPDRVKFTRTLRVVRRRIADPAAFSP